MADIRLSTRLRVYERDGYRCRHCGFGTTRERVLELIEQARRNLGRFPREELLTIDHIVPRSCGGRNVESNLQTLCAPCNHAKADRIPDDVQAPARRVKKQRPADVRERRGRLILRGKDPGGFAKLGDRVRPLPGCDPVFGCVGHCPVPNLGYLLAATR